MTQPLDLKIDINLRLLSIAIGYRFIDWLRLDSYTLSDWSPFWNQLKNEHLQTDNYNCQISQIFISCEHGFQGLKRPSRFPNSGPGNAGNCILDSPILQISQGGMASDPPRSSCLRYSTFAPAARTVYVRQLNHYIRYFQMLPKTLVFVIAISMVCTSCDTS